MLGRTAGTRKLKQESLGRKTGTGQSEKTFRMVKAGQERKGRMART
jgi:hypothetical protein